MCALGASFMRSNISLSIVAYTAMPSILRFASRSTRVIGNVIGNDQGHSVQQRLVHRMPAPIGWN
jgi:hypothetical protein